MDLKKKIKGFFTLTRKANSGFTLVELIVVIAILAILGGVAVPAYSGYVTKANKQADISLASEVADALLLQFYANPQQTLTGSVAISKSGTSVIDSDATFATAAMQSTFGDSWASNALKYDKWGNGAAVTQDVVNYFISITDTENPLYNIFNGNANISYTDNIPELFDLMENTAISIASISTRVNNGAEMVSDAATITMGLDAKRFSELWASSAWDTSYLMGGTGAEYGGNTSTFDTKEKLNHAIANAGVIKARNVALATYLSDLGYGGVADAISNYTYKDASGNATAVPNDAAACFVGEGDLSDLGLTFSSSDEEEAVYYAICDYYGMDYDTLAVADITKTQSYTDGLAYYAMMSTVDHLKTSENLDKTNDETWWNDLYSAVDMYSAVANGKASLSDLSDLYSNMGAVSGNTVLVMLMVQNGVPTVIISPVDANP